MNHIHINALFGRLVKLVANKQLRPKDMLALPALLPQVGCWSLLLSQRGSSSGSSSSGSGLKPRWGCNAAGPTHGSCWQQA